MVWVVMEIPPSSCYSFTFSPNPPASGTLSVPSRIYASLWFADRPAVIYAGHSIRENLESWHSHSPQSSKAARPKTMPPGMTNCTGLISRDRSPNTFSMSNDNKFHRLQPRTCLHPSHSSVFLSTPITKRILIINTDKAWLAYP